MRNVEASFAIRLLGAGPADKADIDRCLAIFVRNTSPLLRTKTNQIRAKIGAPITVEGHFYFAALYRSKNVIGFTMFGYYPRTRLIVIDHMAIDAEHRGASAFYVFAQLLHDAIQTLEVEVDFAVVELEQDAEFGGDQTGGKEMVRLLSQVGFGEVHTEYVLANMEPKNYHSRYKGTLMLRGEQKLHKIRREDLLEIYQSILFDHYLPWYRDFFGDHIATYKKYLEELYHQFERQLHNEPVIMINGPEADALIRNPVPRVARSPEITTIWYLAMFAITAAIATGVLYVLRTPAYLAAPVLLALLALFVGIAAASSGRAFDVFERAMVSVFGNKQRLRYPRSTQSSNRVPKASQRARNRKQELPDESGDTPS